MRQRQNISFDQVLNQVRKDEREVIMEALVNYKDKLVARQDFAEAAAVRDAIVHVQDHVYPGVQMPNNKEGVPDVS